MRFFVVFILSLFFVECGTNSSEAPITPTKPNREQLLHIVDSLETKLRSQQEIDYKLGAAMVMAYINFVNHNQKDAKVVEMLFKAGEVSMSINQSKKAIELFAKVHDEYPPSEKTAMALFLEAYVYENQLKDLDKARGLYSQVAMENPNTRLASDAQACIENLGLSDEELRDKLEKKNKRKK